MNNSRRKRINQCIADLNDAHSQLTTILDEEQKALARISDDEEYDEMRDGMEEIVDGLEDLLPSLQDAIDTLEGADFLRKESRCIPYLFKTPITRKEYESNE